MVYKACHLVVVVVVVEYLYGMFKTEVTITQVLV